MVLEDQERNHLLVCMVVELHIVTLQLHLHLVVEMLVVLETNLVVLTIMVVVVEEALVALEKLVFHYRKVEMVEMVWCMIYLENQ